MCSELKYNSRILRLVIPQRSKHFIKMSTYKVYKTAVITNDMCFFLSLTREIPCSGRNTCQLCGHLLVFGSVSEVCYFSFCVFVFLVYSYMKLQINELQQRHCHDLEL